MLSADENLVREQIAKEKLEPFDCAHCHGKRIHFLAAQTPNTIVIECKSDPNCGSFYVAQYGGFGTSNRTDVAPENILDSLERKPLKAFKCKCGGTRFKAYYGKTPETVVLHCQKKGCGAIRVARYNWDLM